MKAALISGSSSGIGRAISEKLLDNGIKVIGLARDHSKFVPIGKDYVPIGIDLSKVKKLPELIKPILKQNPDIDIFVSSAGYGEFKSLENFSSPQIENFINLNLVSHIVLCRAIVAHMKSQGKGDIFILGSEAGVIGKKKATLYSAAKFGLRGFAQALRNEAGPAGVRVCLINPGMVRSPFFDTLGFEPDGLETNAIETEDIAKIVFDFLGTRQGTIIDEINLSPASKSLKFKKASK
ncbi:SDR family oxidoreductase [bacterium]|nr:SDR family oxidoreductase [bacterium]